LSEQLLTRQRFSIQIWILHLVAAILLCLLQLIRQQQDLRLLAIRLRH
jgi:hypothetical protein